MKKLLLSSALVLSAFCSTTVMAQNSTASSSESYGHTLNVGFGIGYYGYVGHTLPVLHLDYEFDVARNFTLAPFVTMYTYRNYYYWGGPNYPYRNWYYRETVIPVGVKGTYYFDQLLNAGDRWDFYLGGSLGFAFHSVVWENGYEGDRTVVHDASPLYFDGHIGTEYHLSDRIGLFLDLSSGISTVGLGFHL